MIYGPQLRPRSGPKQFFAPYFGPQFTVTGGDPRFFCHPPFPYLGLAATNGLGTGAGAAAVSSGSGPELPGRMGSCSFFGLQFWTPITASPASFLFYFCFLDPNYGTHFFIFSVCTLKFVLVPPYPVDLCRAARPTHTLIKFTHIAATQPYPTPPVTVSLGFAVARP